MRLVAVLEERMRESRRSSLMHKEAGNLVLVRQVGRHLAKMILVKVEMLRDDGFDTMAPTLRGMSKKLWNVSYLPLKRHP